MNALTSYRKRAGLSQGRLAELVGTSQPQIQRLEKGRRGLTKSWALRIAPHIAVFPEDLMFGDRTVAIIGHVGAGAAAHYYAEGDRHFGLARMPPGGSERSVAVEVRGDSLGAPFDGWLIYYDERRDPPTEDLIGLLCVVGLTSGQVLVKMLMQGRVPGRFDLWPAAGAPMTDQQVEWAARVTAVLPPWFAKLEALEPREEPTTKHKKKSKKTKARRSR